PWDLLSPSSFTSYSMRALGCAALHAGWAPAAPLVYPLSRLHCPRPKSYPRILALNEGLSDQNQMHAHDHGHMGHSHSHDHFHFEDIEFKSFLTRKGLVRLLLASSCVLALPLWRRSSRREFAVLGLISLFLGAVEMGKMTISQIRVKLSGVYMGWKQHSLPSQVEPSVAVTEASHITWAGVGVNVLLAAFKFFAGVYGHSAAMIADAGHSLSDLLSDGVTLWAVRMARLPPDEDHPYGHGRFEAVGAFIISIMLITAGYTIGNHSYETFSEILQTMPMPWSPSMAAAGRTTSSRPAYVGPTRLAVSAALLSIILKEALFRATAAVGNKHNSQVLIANAWHHRTDAISSVVALLAILAAMAGLPVIDPIAGLLVAGMVSLTGLQLCVDSIKQLTDYSDFEVRQKLADLTNGVDGVNHCDNVRARQMGSQTLVDLTIQTEGTISVSAAEEVAQRVRWVILTEMPSVSDVLVRTAVDEKPCPVMLTLRPQKEVEADIRQ
ncbi:unnamed protein product, partial [Chrysoparadoxa australica]